jgi:hypothetical protein
MLAILIFLFPIQTLRGVDPLYLDPGSGSILLQTLIAALLGLAFLIRLSWKKIKLFFNRSKSSVEAPQPEKEKEDAG